MPNQSYLEGMRCPSCGSYEPLRIEIRTVIEFNDNGSDELYDLTWDEDNYCECVECNFTGVVKDFEEKKV